MKVTFVRHGKTINHELGKRQAPDSPLGELGKAQAKKVAKHLKDGISNKEYEHILSSSFNRALETAKVISEEVGLEVLENDLIHEILSNPELNNQRMDSDLNLIFLKEVRKHGRDLDWKFKDKGESIREVIERAKKFKEYLLKKYKNKNVLVVTHGTFLRTFLTLLMLSDEYDEKSFIKVMYTLKLENTSVTEVEYSEDEDRWYIESVNVYEHLK